MVQDSAGFRPGFLTTWACRTVVRLPRLICRRLLPIPPNPIAWEFLQWLASQTLKPQLQVPRAWQSISASNEAGICHDQEFRADIVSTARPGTARGIRKGRFDGRGIQCKSSVWTKSGTP